MNPKFYTALRNYCTRYGIDWRFDTIQNPITLIWQVLKVVNELVSDMDELQKAMKDLIDSLEGTIEQKVLDQLQEWYQDGTLGTLINETLFNMKLDKVEFEDYKTIVDTQLAQTTLLVTSFGGKMDGSVDGSQALIDAHDSLPEHGGKITVPAGTLLLTKKVVFTKNVILEGTAVSQLVDTGGSVIFTQGEGSIEFRGIWSSGIRDIMISGDKTNGIGVKMLCSRSWVENVSIINQGSHALQIGSETEALNFNHWYVNNLKAKGNTGDGLRVAHPSTHSPDANAGMAVMLDVGYNGGNGMTLINCFDNEFYGLGAEGNGGYGVQLINSGSHMFSKPYLEANQSGDFHADVNCKRNYIMGHRRDENIEAFVFENDENFILGRDSSKSIFPITNKFGSEKFIISKKGISGFWEFIQNVENRNLEIDLKETSAAALIDFKKGIKTTSLTFNSGKINDYIFKLGYLNYGSVETMGEKEVVIDAPNVVVNDSVVVNIFEQPAKTMVNAFVNENGKVIVRLFNYGETRSLGQLRYYLSVIKTQM